MSGTTREERLQIMLTAVELEALDSWRFSAHMPSRAAAIRELLRRGLASEGFAVADRDLKSRDFGVTSKTRSSIRMR
ncbi:MAG: hypothetical protein ACJ8IR_03185 [Alphaproteobacteria bacterium]|jgi:hypothetical protein